MKQADWKERNWTLVFSAVLLAIGIVLPFFTGQIPQIGNMLLPMHLPVLLCGLLCGWQYGGVVGFVLPLLRGLMFGAPALFPNGIAMAFELASYGVLAGLCYRRTSGSPVADVYRALIPAMIGGRVVWGTVRVLLTGAAGAAFTWQMFLTGAVLNAFPGIALQLILVPLLAVALDRAGMWSLCRCGAGTEREIRK